MVEMHSFGTLSLMLRYGCIHLLAKHILPDLEALQAPKSMLIQDSGFEMHIDKCKACLPSVSEKVVPAILNIAAYCGWLPPLHQLDGTLKHLLCRTVRPDCQPEQQRST